MKILQIIQKRQRRGAEIFACQLSRELLTLGHQVDVLYLFDGPASLNFDLNFIALHARASRRFWDIAAYKRLNDLIRENGYDIVQANAGDTLKYAALSKWLFNWKACLVFRNANKISDFMNGFAKRWLNKFFLMKVDHVISVSKICRQDFIDTFEFPPSRVDTVEVGVDILPVDSLDGDLPEIYGFNKVVINVAGLVPEKNHARLLAIFKTIVAQVPDARLLIVGEGPLEGELRECAGRLGLAAKVVFAGRRQDVFALMRLASAFVLPSRIEGLPAVILEAQFCQVPVVAYNVGGIAEVLDAGTGWLVDKDDEDTFAAYVVSILKGDIAVQPVLEKARRRVVSDFNNRVIAARFSEVYTHLKDLR